MELLRHVAQLGPAVHWDPLEQMDSVVHWEQRALVAQMESRVLQACSARWGQSALMVPAVQRMEPLARSARQVLAVRSARQEALTLPVVRLARRVLAVRSAQTELRARWGQSEVSAPQTYLVQRWGPAESLLGQIPQRVFPGKVRWNLPRAGGGECRGRPSRAGREGRRRGQWRREA